MRNIWLIMPLLLLGCAASSPQVARIVMIEPQVPASMLRCAPSPAVPQAGSQAVVAQYVVALWQAGEDCRTHVRAIAQALRGQPSKG